MSIVQISNGGSDHDVENINHIYWSGESSPNSISVPDYLDRNAKRIRGLLLKWISARGSVDCNGRSLYQQLKISNGISFWYITSIGQKFNFARNSGINYSLKLIALEEILLKINPSSIILKLEERDLSIYISNFAKSRNIKIINKVDKSKNINNLQIIRHVVLGTTYFFYKILITILKKKHKKNNEIKSDIAIFDVFTHFKNNNNDEFESNYWGELVNKINEWGLTSSYYHFFYRKEAQSEGIEWAVNRARAYSKSRETHEIIEEYISIGIIFKALLSYLRNFKIVKYTDSIFEEGPGSTKVTHKSLYKNDYIESIIGLSAAYHILRIFIIENMLKSIPRKKVGIYLYENQPWEQALNYYWKKYNHGKLVGFAHSTVRFWDLRYSYQNDRVCEDDLKHYKPDFIAVTGELAYEEMLMFGVPKVKLECVEALRYLYLNNKPSQRNGNDYCQRVLVLGDFDRSENRSLISIMNKLLENKKYDFKIQYKQHPAFQEKLKIDKRIVILNNEHEIADLFGECDIVIAGPSTSSSMEAFIYGRKVYQLRSQSGLITSPLRGVKGVRFIRNADEIVESIAFMCDDKWSSRQNILYLDSNLKRWKDLVDNCLWCRS